MVIACQGQVNCGSVRPPMLSPKQLWECSNKMLDQFFLMKNISKSEAKKRDLLVFVFSRHKQPKHSSIYSRFKAFNDSENRPPVIKMAHQFNYFTMQACPLLCKAWGFLFTLQLKLCQVWISYALYNVICSVIFKVKLSFIKLCA